MSVVRQQCGSCPSASAPEAARLPELQHHVQELVDSAARAGETARFEHEPVVPGCRVRVPARKVCEWEPASHFVQRREDVHADIVRNGVDGVLRGRPRSPPGGASTSPARLELSSQREEGLPAAPHGRGVPGTRPS